MRITGSILASWKTKPHQHEAKDKLMVMAGMTCKSLSRASDMDSGELLDSVQSGTL